ncbi:hypothetical protein GOBAR_DD14273 [Gossypium barbadense]|nr:hypothetical protein GOBAR_DD14273 [Gossypium barbadense]
MSFRKNDLINLLQVELMKAVEHGEANAALEYFEAKRTNDPSLYMTYTKDEDNQLQNIFWADSYYRIDYAYFRDVAFDTTYKNNVCMMYEIKDICADGYV